MYAPIFLPPVPKPSPEVLAAERAILAAEGPSHVDGRYFARPGDADRQRRLVAECRVQEAARRAAITARHVAHDESGASRSEAAAVKRRLARAPAPRC